MNRVWGQYHMIIRRATREAVWIQVVFGFLDSHRICVYLLYLFFLLSDVLNQSSYYDRTKRQVRAFTIHPARITPHEPRVRDNVISGSSGDSTVVVLPASRYVKSTCA